MASSDQNIQPAGRSGGAGGSPQGFPQGTFQGTVTGMRVEHGVQTLEIMSSQGRMRLQADGDFHLGDHIRLSLAPGGPVTVEKSASPQPQAGDWQGVGYTLPQNLTAAHDVRTFEEQLAAWTAGRNPGTGKPATAPPGTPPGGGLATLLEGEADSLLRLPLPELLKRALVRDGGRDFVAKTVAGLDAGAFSYLMAALEEARSEPGMAALVEMVKGMRSGQAGSADARRGATSDAGSAAGKAGALLMGGNGFATAAAAAEEAEWQAEAGAGAAPWFGRVADKQEAGATFSAMSRLGNWTAPKEAPLFKYLIDLGGGTPEAPRTMTAYSAQERAPGEFVDFELEKGPRLTARFLDPAQALPQQARAAFDAAPPELRPALQVASHYLREFRNEPYFNQLTRDFAEVLAQSGRLETPEQQAAAAAGGGGGARGGRPPPPPPPKQK
jgi:hypothetical protein